MSEMPELSVELQQKLLRIARETMEEYIRYHTIPEFTVEEPELTRKCGAFVTITSSQRLRGCIGYVGFKPLYQTVIDMAIALYARSAFEPVREQELLRFNRNFCYEPAAQDCRSAGS